jgi:hypothetical protein
VVPALAADPKAVATVPAKPAATAAPNATDAPVIRHIGAVCGSLGSVEIEPSVLLPVGGKDTLAFLSCSTCLPSWEIKYVPIDKPPWSVVDREGSDRFRCPGCGKAVAWRIHGRLGGRRIRGPRSRRALHHGKVKPELFHKRTNHEGHSFRTHSIVQSVL